MRIVQIVPRIRMYALSARSIIMFRIIYVFISAPIQTALVVLIIPVNNALLITL